MTEDIDIHVVTQAGGSRLRDKTRDELIAVVNTLLDMQDAHLDRISGLEALLDARGVPHRLPSGARC